MLWDILLGVAVAALATWVALLVGLLIVRPRGPLLKEALRLLPDLLRLLRRLAGDATLPRGVRVRLGLLMAYLAIPIDLIPDFVPVIGYADDAIIVARGAARGGPQSGCRRGASALAGHRGRFRRAVPADRHPPHRR